MGEKFAMECNIQRPEYTMTDQIEVSFSDDPANSSICDLSDEEISTKKEKHLRLGPEDLNDTLLHDIDQGL